MKLCVVISEQAGNSLDTSVEVSMGRSVSTSMETYSETCVATSMETFMETSVYISVDTFAANYVQKSVIISVETCEKIFEEISWKTSEEFTKETFLETCGDLHVSLCGL